MPVLEARLDFGGPYAKCALKSPEASESVAGLSGNEEGEIRGEDKP